MDYDSYLDRQLEKHNNEQEMAIEVSNCCGEQMIDDSDICTHCGEHCESLPLGEHLYNEKENAECDKADELRGEL